MQYSIYKVPEMEQGVRASKQGRWRGSKGDQKMSPYFYPLLSCHYMPLGNAGYL
jgi:hypothetical protein